MAEIVSTGIERLDEALIDDKGITLGSCVLIEGSSVVVVERKIMRKELAQYGSYKRCNS